MTGEMPPGGFAEDEAEQTLAASSDVVAEIRSQAAALRAGSAANTAGHTAPPDATQEPQIQVWRPSDFDEVDPTTVIRPPASPAEPPPRDLVAPEPTIMRSSEADNGASLIAGLAPPASSRTYWESGSMAPTPSVARTSTAKASVPLWLLIVVALVAVVAISIAVALVLTSGGTTT